MRISEKTVELNFCSQFTRLFNGGIIWFGLTQRQEAQAGFDACTKVGGLLFSFSSKHQTRMCARLFLSSPMLAASRRRIGNLWPFRHGRGQVAGYAHWLPRGDKHWVDRLSAGREAAEIGTTTRHQEGSEGTGASEASERNGEPWWDRTTDPLIKSAPEG
jgi:hypothetical protein